MGSLQTVASDLNHDGYPDLIFCPNYKGVQNTRRFVTIIYGGDDGWPSYRSAGLLPGDDIKAVAVADLNHDCWEDIVTLNKEAWSPNQPAGNIVRIFWGGPGGHISTRYYDIGIKEAVGITTSDFDNNSFPDLAVLTREGEIVVYWSVLEGSKERIVDTTCIRLNKPDVISISSGDCNNDKINDILVGAKEKIFIDISPQKDRNWTEQLEIESKNASGLVVGDIDKDGYNDLLISTFSQRYAAGGEFMGVIEGFSEAVNIMWGGKSGFSAANTTKLEAKNLSSSAFGDFDGDGLNDVAIAINRGDTDFKTQSIIYFGSGNRKFIKGGSGITTTGAFNVIAVPGANHKNQSWYLQIAWVVRSMKGSRHIFTGEEQTDSVKQAVRRYLSEAAMKLLQLILMLMEKRTSYLWMQCTEDNRWKKTHGPELTCSLEKEAK